jgi:cyclic pyranopterin phosphate synthase
MTTNGWRLKSLARNLWAAGLNRLNISLDSIDRQTYRALTGGELKPVLKGIDAAIAEGFPPPRLNAVVLSGVNDHQLPDMVSWATQRNMEMRFLEAMPIGPAADFNRAHFVPASQIKEMIRTRFTVSAMPRLPGETATRYRVSGAAVQGTVGIIAPISEPFCGQCRRIRLTADGKLFPCLLDSRFTDMSSCWDDTGFLPDKAETLMTIAATSKSASGLFQQHAAMIKLGG